MASLKVMDSDGAKSDLFSYRGEARIVVLAGTASLSILLLGRFLSVLPRSLLALLVQKYKY